MTAHPQSLEHRRCHHMLSVLEFVVLETCVGCTYINCSKMNGSQAILCTALGWPALPSRTPVGGPTLPARVRSAEKESACMRFQLWLPDYVVAVSAGGKTSENSAISVTM